MCTIIWYPTYPPIYPVQNICVTNHHGYIPFVIIAISNTAMTYQRIFNKSNTTGGISGAGTAYHSRVHEFTAVLYWGSCYL